MTNNSSCYTSDQPYSPFVLSGICLVSFIISLPGVILGIHQYCVKNKLSILRTERLLLYLSFVAFAFSFLGCFQWIAHFASKGDRIAEKGCAALGYLWFTVAIFFLFITLCIGIHFLAQICQPKCLKVTVDEKIKLSKRMEFGYITMSTVVAVTCSPWPFLSHSFGYNLWICWIISTKPSPNDDGSCIELKPGTIVTTSFYAATLIVFIFSCCIMVIVQILSCTQKRVFPYVWVFTSYLIVTLIVMFVTMVINFINPEDVPPVLHGIKILSIGLLPLIASLVTTIAIVSNIVDLIKYSTQTHHQIINEDRRSLDAIRGYGTSSSENETSHWIPPPTNILD